MLLLLRGFSYLLGLLPHVALRSCARLLARPLYLMLGGRRRLMEKNLAIALGNSTSAEERRQIAQGSLYQFLLTCLEFFAARRTPLGENCRIVGGEHLQAALSKGQGAYVLCSHMSNWEAMGIVSFKFAPVYVAVKKIGNPTVNRFVRQRREQNGLHTIKREQRGTGIRAIVKTLKAGGVVGFMMDQARPGEPLLPFFGRPAQTNTSLAAISRRFPAPIVPGYLLRDEQGGFVLHFLPALELVSHPDADEELLLRSAAFNRVVEGIIRSAPEQYFWLHDRWKLRKRG